MEAEDIGMIWRLLAAPARLLRAGATLTLDFMIRNPIRDQFSAFINSKYGFIPGVDLVRGIFEYFGKKDAYKLWQIAGGEHSMLVSLDREYLQSTFDDLVKKKGGMFFKYVKHPVEALRILSEIGEEATRLGEMKRALNAGATPAEAAFAAREVTLDFARVGSKTRALNAIIAFWNANIEGTDKVIRSFKDRPFRTLLKVLIGITLPSILLYFVNRKDPRWKEIPAWQKDLFWIVMTKNHIYRIPKPFGLGQLFGTIPEKILEFIDKDDKEVFDSMWGSVLNSVAPGFIPTAMAPIIEDITNYSFFLDRPIVPSGKESLPAEAQYGDYTSEVAKMAGKALGYSPAKIDNLIQGYTGGLGKYVISALDSILKGTGIVRRPVSPEQSIENMPVVKSFMIREPIGSSSESVNRIYTMYSDTNGGTQYVNSLMKSGDTDAAQAYLDSHPELVYAKAIRDVVYYFSDINKYQDQIRNDDTMTAKEKKEAIRDLDITKTDIAQQLLEQIKDDTNQ
jgi:hypothetical protein